MKRLVRLFWGEMTAQELKQFTLLSLIFFVIIGSYWLMRVLKDAQFALLVGYRYEPLAKMLTLAFVVLVLLSYNKLIDFFKKISLFYAVCLFFGACFIVLGYLIQFFSIQRSALAVGSTTIFPLTASKLVGWLTFCFLESFGSLLPALFWSFVSSRVTTESAKRGYGMVFMFGQLGAIGGSSISFHFSKNGLGNLFMVGGSLVILIPFLVSLYMKYSPPQEESSYKDREDKPTGIFEGFRLLMNYPYVAGLFVVTTAYEIVGTIIEYQMGLTVLQVYPPNLDLGAGIAMFKSLNGMAINLLSLLFALLGTSFFMRRFGLRFCLATFPVTVGLVIILLLIFYIMGVGPLFLMWAFFGAEVIFRGLNYTLNNPSKEVMYIPTSADIKFKAKSWTDMFGSRATKGAGAFLTKILGGSVSLLFVAGSIVSLGIVAFWIMMAFFVGNTFNKLQEEKRTIG